MQVPVPELVISGVAIAGFAAVHALLAQSGIPKPSSLAGLTLGGAGLLLMLGAQTLYSIRKRRRGFHFGSLSVWLRAHIVMGLLGAYLALMHSGFRFAGLAGVLTVLMLVVVASGFVGRYLYTAVPRTIEGDEFAGRELLARLEAIENELLSLGVASHDSGPALPAPPSWLALFLRPLRRWRERRRRLRASRKAAVVAAQRAWRADQLLAERADLQWQVDSLLSKRRWFAMWHLFHVPLTGMLFALACLHVAGALYYMVHW